MDNSTNTNLTELESELVRLWAMRAEVYADCLKSDNEEADAWLLDVVMDAVARLEDELGLPRSCVGA